MECPKELKAEEKKLWKKVMESFEPLNPVEEEMGRRYFDWLLLFQTNKKVVHSEGSVTQGKNGVPYPNPAFTNMVKAEGEMRRLYKQLETRFKANEPIDDNGEFSNL